MSTRLHGWIADESGCGYYRIKQPYWELDKHRGWDVTINPWLRGEDIPDLDVLIGQRVSTEDTFNIWMSIAQNPEGPKLVYEVDDNLFEVDPTNMPAYDYYKLQDTQHRMIISMNAADALFLSSQALADYFREVNENIYVVPNYIEKAALKRPQKKKSDITVGWAGGSGHVVDIPVMAGPLKRWREKNPDLRFYNYGTDFRELIGIEKAEYIPWVNDPIGYLKSLNVDIGLCPLKESLFNYSKTELKALEYSARGIAVIASNMTPYQEFIEHGKTGLLVNSEKEWDEALDELTNNHDYRYQLTLAAFEKAKKRTIENNVTERIKIIEKILAE